MKKSEIVKRIFSYMKKHVGFLVLSVVFALITVISTLMVPVLIGKSIDKMIGVGRVDFGAIWHYLVIIGVLIVITMTTQWIMSLCNNKVVYLVSRDIRNDAVRKIEKLPLRYLDSRRYGDIVSTVISDAELFTEGMLLAFSSGMTGIITLIATTVIMFNINTAMAVIVICSSPLAMFLTIFISKNSYKYFRKQTVARGNETGYMEEMITGSPIIQSYNMQDKVLNDFDDYNEKLKVHAKKAYFFSSLSNPSSRFVYSIIYACLAFGGTYFALKGDITVGQLVSFLSYANQFTKPFNELTDIVSQIQNSIVCADRIFNIIDEEAEIPDKKNADIIRGDEYTVEFKDVCFSYNKEKKLIEDLNLKAENGMKIAIVGPTGCGKTTLINLLMRFYDIDSGSITINGTDIRDMTRADLRKHFGMVLQDTWIKSGTIRDNIAFSKLDATDEEVREAARSAFADNFITKLKDGYDTVVGEDGGSLSQGQKQLLCIARIMLQKPPMLILDEATSSIDTRTEKKVQEAFDNLMKDRTSFIVAHRLSTIQSADMIIVMKDGKIIERGTHEELLRGKGFYSNLYMSQF